MTDRPDPPYAILCVCTGNICRSPIAERLLAARLGPEVAVVSAGTLGLVGRGIQPEMAAQLGPLGLPEVDFAARRLTPDDVRAADLVLGLGREHRAAAVELVPGAVRRAFTLLELARLLAEVAPEELPDGGVADRLRALVPLVSARRRRAAGPVDVDDVIDPYRRSQADYERSFAAIRDAVETIAGTVGGYSGLSRT